MRVIGGTFRGMNLAAPKDEAVRPTSDRSKEDLFNIIAPFMVEALVLDLFSGSGAIAIEAISRGAKHADMVESSRASQELIMQNVQKTRSEGSFSLIKADAVKYLNYAAGKYDIIFMDPPYAFGDYSELIRIIDSRGLLRESGVLIAETAKKTLLPKEIGGLRLWRTKSYSLAAMHYYTYTREEHK